MVCNFHMDSMEVQTDGSSALICEGRELCRSVIREGLRNAQADNLLFFLM